MAHFFVMRLPANQLGTMSSARQILGGRTAGSRSAVPAGRHDSHAGLGRGARMSVPHTSAPTTSRMARAHRDPLRRHDFREDGRGPSAGRQPPHAGFITRGINESDARSEARFVPLVMHKHLVPPGERGLRRLPQSPNRRALLEALRGVLSDLSRGGLSEARSDRRQDSRQQSPKWRTGRPRRPVSIAPQTANSLAFVPRYAPPAIRPASFFDRGFLLLRNFPRKVA